MRAFYSESGPETEDNNQKTNVTKATNASPEATKMYINNLVK